MSALLQTCFFGVLCGFGITAAEIKRLSSEDSIVEQRSDHTPWNRHDYYKYKLSQPGRVGAAPDWLD